VKIFAGASCDSEKNIKGILKEKKMIKTLPMQSIMVANFIAKFE
jgi:hypothetical protein